MRWRYEQNTKTIRSIPENYWIASMDSWDGAVDHKANGELIARAPLLEEQVRILREASKALIDWMQDAESELGGPLKVGYKALVQKPVIVEKMRIALETTKEEV